MPYNTDKLAHTYIGWTFTFFCVVIEIYQISDNRTKANALICLILVHSYGDFLYYTRILTFIFGSKTVSN